MKGYMLVNFGAATSEHMYILMMTSQITTIFITQFAFEMSKSD